MSIISSLATAQNRRDEVPNVELAKKVVQGNDKEAVKELFENLRNKNRNIQSDCIKVIYEIGALKPALISAYVPDLLSMLDSKANRLQWGAMAALDAVTTQVPMAIYNALPQIISCADKGTVITNDHCVGILIKLCAIKEYEQDAFSLLNERLATCPTNQLPMYAENALPIITEKNRTVFVNTLTRRLTDVEKESKKARVEKVIKKAANLRFV